MGYMRCKQGSCAWCRAGAGLYAVLPCQGAQTHPLLLLLFFFFSFCLWRH